jgi:predicted PurR-regulated permease PerM
VTENQTETNREVESPKWGWTTKLVVGLALVAITLLLLVRFQDFLGSLIAAILLSYLINPIAKLSTNKLKIPWRVSVTVLYILLVVIVLGLMTWGGFALFEQIQNLINFIERNIFQLPEIVSEFTDQTFQIGPLSFSLDLVNWDEIVNEIVRAIQPALGQLGSLVGSVAAGAVNVISSAVLIVLISYFLLAESDGFPDQFFNINLGRNVEDMQRIGDELNRIWSAFIRGELLVVLISYIIYTIMLGILRVQFFAGLAAIAAIGQLIPYLGAWASWISFGLVALFQANIPFNVPPIVYMVVVLAISMGINTIIDNIIRTKVMASGLRVHPALVLIGAIIGVQLFGFIGIVIAAPIMATFKLFLVYILRKLNDQYPWEQFEEEKPIEKSKWVVRLENAWQTIKHWLISQWNRLRKNSSQIKPGKPKTESKPHPPKD